MGVWGVWGGKGPLVKQAGEKLRSKEIPEALKTLGGSGTLQSGSLSSSVEATLSPRTPVDILWQEQHLERC